ASWDSASVAGWHPKERIRHRTAPGRLPQLLPPRGDCLKLCHPPEPYPKVARRPEESGLMSFLLWRLQERSLPRRSVSPARSLKTPLTPVGHPGCFTASPTRSSLVTLVGNNIAVSGERPISGQPTVADYIVGRLAREDHRLLRRPGGLRLQALRRGRA